MSTIPKDEIGKLAEDCWNKRKEKGETEFAEPIDYMVGFVDGYQLATDGREQKTDFQIAWELSQTKDKPFFIDIVRALIRSYDDEEISLSKLVEELNIMSVKWHENNDGREELEKDNKRLRDGIKWALDNPQSVFVFNELQKLLA